MRAEEQAHCTLHSTFFPHFSFFFHPFFLPFLHLSFTLQEEAIDTVLDSGERLEIGLLLSALSTVVGSALLIPTGPFTIAFTRRSSVDRELGLAVRTTLSLRCLALWHVVSCYLCCVLCVIWSRERSR